MRTTARIRQQWDGIPALVLLPVPEKVPTGIGVIRSLGRAGVPLVVASPQHAPLSFTSRYVSERLHCPDLDEDTEAYVEWLIAAGQHLGGKVVLFPTTDEQLVLVNQRRDRLAPTYLYPYLSSDALLQCISKSKSLEAAQRVGLGVPSSVLVNGDITADEVVRRVGLPCVIKPDNWVKCEDGRVRRDRELRRALVDKVVRVETEEQLRGLLDELRMLGADVVAQEEIPGGCDEIFMCLVYASAAHGTIPAYVGRKTRQFPSDFGTCTLAEPMWRSEVAEYAKHWAESVGLVGIADVEMKLDVRTSEYKGIEINPRCPTWVTAALASGVNVPHMAYLDLLGHQVGRPEQTESGLWIDGVRDLAYFLTYRTGDHQGRRLRLGDYLRSLQGRREYAYFTVHDPLPGCRRLLDIAYQSVCSLSDRFWKRS